MIKEPPPGMDLRDWFAGMALTGVVMRGPESTAKEVADWCYHVADALVQARDASKQSEGKE